MRWFPRSIRWRIQLWHGLLLVLVLGGFTVTAYRLQVANEYRRLDAELARRVTMLARVLDQNGRAGGGFRQGPPREARDWPPPDGPPPDDPEPRPGPAGGFRVPPELADLFPTGAPDGFYFLIWRRDGEVLARSAMAPAELSLPPHTHPDFVRTRGEFRECAHFTPPGECLLAGISEKPTRQTLARLAGALAALGGGILLLGLGGGWWLANRAIAPIGAISSTARRIADGQLQERIEAGETESELGQLAEVLNETFTRLEGAFARQQQFTSDAAHELRTPVSIILAHAQLALTRSRSPDEYRETLATIQRSAHRMRGLVESLLQLATLDAKSESLRRAECDLAELAREQMELVAPLAAERGIALQADFAPAPCQGDTDRLAQIFTNLLGNAVKYCDRGDAVRISTGTQNGHAIARVADTGPGIPAEHLPHVFERFYRVDASRTRSTGGAGLGLAICQTIAHAHGGDLKVEPADNGGVIFTLHVPRMSATQPC